MKQNKLIIPFDYSALISPIAPKFNPMDGIGSLFNLTGTYYNINSNLSTWHKATQHIIELNDVWKYIGQDLYSATSQFAKLNNLDIPSFKYKTSDFLESPWKK